MPLDALPRIVSVDSSCGCTLTRASIKGLTPEEFENFANKEIDLARVIMASAEAKALGVPESSLSTLLKSSIKNIKPALNEQKIDQQSIILPYIQRKQPSHINYNYFNVVAGAAGDAGELGVHAGAWRITVTLSVSPWATPIKNIERYFLPGMSVYVMTWDNTTDKTAKMLQFKIVSAANADAGEVARATILMHPNITSAGFTALSAGDKALRQPTFGVIQTGANNVNDYEEWCHNRADDLSMGLVVNWFQTSRETRCVDDEYKRMIDEISSGKVNEYQRGFNWRPLAEQNRRAIKDGEDAWMRSVWFNDRINENQTPNGYELLPTVTDPEDDTCVLEYKANALGVWTMLAEANRVIDVQGAALDIDVVFAELYRLKRNREADGDRVQVIDCMTDRMTAMNIHSLMAKYYKAKYGVGYEKHFQVGQKLVFDNEIMFNYNVYDVPDAGVQWAVFHDPFFDDQIAAFPDEVASVDQSFKDRARALWFIDWSDLSTGIAGTNSVTRKHPNPDVQELYKCRMNAVVKEYNLRSTKWTVLLDRPSRHAVWINFSDACPTLDATGCDPTVA